jgi:hypothetical protein
MPYGRLWPAHPKPLEDELLSSWWVRLARANHERLHSFTRIILPGHAVWNRDLDKSASDETLRLLSRKTGTTYARVQATTLQGLTGCLFPRFNAHGNTKWILPIGVYHRTRRRYGLQFCPQCLRTDAVPYFRRLWRLAFVTMCPVHWTPLLDRCPACGAAVAFHRREFGAARSSIANHPITLCQQCDFDLCDAVAISEPIQTPIRGRAARHKRGKGQQEQSRQSMNLTRLGYFQQWLLQGIERGHFDLSDLEPGGLRRSRSVVLRTSGRGDRVVSAVAFFEGLHAVVTLLSTDCGDRGYPARAPRWTGPKPDARRVRFCRLVRLRLGVAKTATGATRGQHGFEPLSAGDRRLVMCMTAYAMQCWPNRFLFLCREAGLTSSRVFRDFPTIIPDWFERLFV